ncbi:MAG: MYXO-CTERM sorting domain-containing protein [Byssovorax sp.]
MLRCNPSRLASLFTLVGAVLASSSALAVQAPINARRASAVTSTRPAVSSGGLEAAPGQPALPLAIRATWGAPPSSRRAAWARFERAHGEGWQALWDRDTEAPIRVLGRGIPAPGSVADAAAAEAQARAFLAEHLDLFAPGVPVDRFVLVTNDLDAGMRTVAFEQRAAVVGLAPVPVIGGRFNIRFKNDRLFVFGSEAIASGAPLAPPRISRAAAELAARAWIAEMHDVVALDEATTLVALPLAREGQIALRLAHRVVIEADAPRARYVVYVDAVRGAPIAREQLLRFSGAQVEFDAPVRAPQLGRQSYPAQLLELAVDGVDVASDVSGGFTWATGTPGALTMSPAGALIAVVNFGGDPLVGSFSAVDGQPVLWSLADAEQGDAQLASYIHASLVKAHAALIAPTMPFLKAQLKVQVNEDDPQGCNAFWNGTAVNFFQAKGNCNNTARLADVVYHEFGHGFHQHAILAGAGALDGALGEGTGDIMSTSMTHDSHLAPGFFVGPDNDLRDMDSGRRWPQDISFDIHETGLIWAGAMWDLRTFLVSDLGAAAGHALTDQLYYQAIRRSSSIPATYAEVVAADDDDGDLSNGTPHICAINRAFVAHGLSSTLDGSGLVIHHAPLSLVSGNDPSYPIDVTTEVLYPQCATGALDSVNAVVTTESGPATIDLSPGADGHYRGSIPKRAAGMQLQYQVIAQEGDATLTLPDNRADDHYRVFVGETHVLYENDFETSIDGWTFGDPKDGKGDFEWGAPQGLAGDPAAAFSGTKVLGDRLSGTGVYRAGRVSFADSPVVDLKGEEHVRLQLRRWLTVQDGFFDQASIYVNGTPVWGNASTSMEDGSLEHRDREWRFEDIDLAPYLHGSKTAQIRFEMAADGAKQFGGWNLDDVRIVAYHPPRKTILVGVVAEPAATAPDLDLAGGCACSAAASSPGRAPLALAAIGLLGLAARRRRRR